MTLLDMPVITPSGARLVRRPCSMNDTALRREQRSTEEMKALSLQYQRIWTADARAKKAEHYKRMARLRVLRARIKKLELFGEDTKAKIERAQAEIERLEGRGC